MFPKRLRCAGFLVLSCLIFSSCSSLNKLMKSTDNDLKYEAAVKYYEQKKYYHSLQLLEELITIYRGTKRAEEVYYYYAMSYYGTGEFLTAAFHLSNFAKTFPKPQPRSMWT